MVVDAGRTGHGWVTPTPLCVQEGVVGLVSEPIGQFVCGSHVRSFSFTCGVGRRKGEANQLASGERPWHPWHGEVVSGEVLVMESMLQDVERRSRFESCCRVHPSDLKVINVTF